MSDLPYGKIKPTSVKSTGANAIIREVSADLELRFSEKDKDVQEYRYVIGAQIYCIHNNIVSVDQINEDVWQATEIVGSMNGGQDGVQIWLSDAYGAGDGKLDLVDHELAVDGAQGSQWVVNSQRYSAVSEWLDTWAGNVEGTPGDAIPDGKFKVTAEAGTGNLAQIQSIRVSMETRDKPKTKKASEEYRYVLTVALMAEYKNVQQVALVNGDLFQMATLRGTLQGGGDAAGGGAKAVEIYVPTTFGADTQYFNLTHHSLVAIGPDGGQMVRNNQVYQIFSDWADVTWN